ncbi:MAG: hypothetical protein LAO24_03690 [Acidobacteriia bacterium]|nr:hypothetical protein [Terriglobia bacterium]
MTDKRYADLMNTESILLKVRVTAHMQKVLLRETKGYQNVLHKRCGAGLTSKQFEGLVQMLVEHEFCIITVGERGAAIISLNEGNDAND